MIALGFIKTGLGCRIAPAMPSNIARCGGLIYPITDSLSRNFESYPENEFHSKVGAFLVSGIGNMNDIKTKKGAWDTLIWWKMFLDGMLE